MPVMRGAYEETPRTFQQEEGYAHEEGFEGFEGKEESSGEEEEHCEEEEVSSSVVVVSVQAIH